MPCNETAAADLDLEEVTSPAALESLRTAWGALWARCPEATPFQTPEWLIPWWDRFGSGDLWVLALRQDDRLVGLAPLYVGAPGDAPARIVRLLGSGNTDYLDVLAEPGLEETVMEAVCTYLQAQQDRWDRCDLLQLRPGSPLLSAPVPDGWTDETAAADTCPILTLSAPDADAAIPDSFLKKLRYYRRRTARFGTLRIEQAGGSTFDTAFEALLRLHGARWAERDGPGMLAAGDVQHFHRTVARGLLRRGLLRLYTMYLDEQVVASYYGFVHRDRAYYYLSGFDPAFGKLSPGNLIVYHAIQEAAREGARHFDFLRGREAYKYRWGAEDQQNQQRRLRHAPLTSTAVARAPPDAPFTVSLSVSIRPCIEDDLPRLEWFGLFTEHREIIRSAFEAQRRGENVMLMADAGGAPVGQVWIDLARMWEKATGFLWAVRVFPWLQGRGIGQRLVLAAERLLRSRGFRYAELGVETDNPRARRFYERLGYRLTGTRQDAYSYTTPEGVHMRIPLEEWVLQKRLESVSG